MAVLGCLSSLATVLEHEIALLRLVDEVHSLRRTAAPAPVNKRRRKKAPKVKPSLSSLPLPSPDGAMSEQEAHPADVPETDSRAARDGLAQIASLETLRRGEHYQVDRILRPATPDSAARDCLE